MKIMFKTISILLFGLIISYSQDFTFVKKHKEKDKLKDKKSELLEIQSLVTRSSTVNEIQINYDNSLLIPKKVSSSPSLWEITKSTANSYLNNSVFADNCPVDMDFYWWNNNQTVFCLDPYYERIVFASTTSNTVKSFGEENDSYQFSRPLALTVSEDGYIFVADNGNNKIVKLRYNTGSNEISYVASYSIPGMINATDIYYCKGFSYDPSTNCVWVMDREAGKLFVISKAGQLIDTYDKYSYGGTEYGLSGITQISSDNQRNYMIRFFDNLNKRFVEAYMPINGGSTLTVKWMQKFPRNTYLNDLGTDCNNDVYVSDMTNKCVHKFANSDGTYLGSFKQANSNFNGFANPKRLSSFQANRTGYVLLEFYTNDAWGNSNGIRTFLPSANCNSLTYNSDSQNYYFNMLMTSNASATIQVYKNNQLVKQENNYELVSGENEYSVSASLISNGNIKFKITYENKYNSGYGNYSQPAKSKEINFVTTIPLSVNITGPSTAQCQTSTWYSNVTGGKSPFTYKWYHMWGFEGENDDPVKLIRSGGSGWNFIDDTQNLNFYLCGGNSTLKVVVTDDNGNTTEDTHLVSGASAKQNENKDKLIPEITSLTNFPNPFNPVTTIDYQLPEKTFVEIVVFNSLGQKVIALVKDYKEAGYYSVKFNGDNLASGIYYATLKTKQTIITKKLLLMK